jgi:hypothetical protein
MTHQDFSCRNRFNSVVMIFAVAILPLAASCGDGGSGTGPTEKEVGSVTIASDPLTLPIRAETSIMVLVKDNTGKLLAGESVTFSTSSPEVATVDPDGTITAVGEGSATIKAAAGGKSASLAVSVRILDFVEITAGWLHTCGLTSQGQVWCWGNQSRSELGIGDQTPTGDHPHAVESALVFKSIDADNSATCGLTLSGMAYCWGSFSWGTLADSHNEEWSSPTATPGDLSFKTISVGFCGVTTEDRAYCWGTNNYGELGTGDALTHDTFVPVAGDLLFETVAANNGHACGVTSGGDTYCWGRNEYGTLGTGSTDNSGVPVPISGGLLFQSFPTTQNWGSCGITIEGEAYCWGWWGWNHGEEFHIQGSDIRTTPTLIPGGLDISSMGVGEDHGCAVTTSDAAFCWGTNDQGQLGDGSRTFRAEPTPVSGNHSFVQIVAGGTHTCGLTASGSVYCWGDNSFGQLGAGSGMQDSAEPILIHGSR